MAIFDAMFLNSKSTAHEKGKSLLKRQSFVALLATLYLGAFNDNIFRSFVAILILHGVSTQSDSLMFLSLQEAFFVLPFVVFSTYGGWLGDKFPKSHVIKLLKLLEVIAMALALFFLFRFSAWGLTLVVALMGAQSALLSPSKYGLLPEIVEEKQLSRANGYVEFLTFSAIVFGLAFGGLIAALIDDRAACGLICLLIAGFGVFSSLFICRSPEQACDRSFSLNPFSDIAQVYREIKPNRGLLLSILGVSLFWFVAVFGKLAILLYAKDVLLLGELGTAGVLVFLALGVGLGSLASGFVSGAKVELALVPLGALGMGFMSFCIALSSSTFIVLPLVFFLGIFSGMYIVPLNSYVQINSPSDARASCIAAMNAFSYSLALIASFLPWLLVGYLSMPIWMLFVVLAIVTLLCGAYLVKLMPQMLLRFVNWILSNAIYSVKTLGVENIPETGGGLIVCNHGSYVDANLLLASCPRPIRFIMSREIYNRPFVKPIAKVMEVIPIDPSDSPKKLVAAFKEARTALKNGELLCIFAEGAITRLGTMTAFNKGLEKIVKGLTVPIIPAYIDRIWGSVFSFRDGETFFQRPKEFPYKVSLGFSTPLAATSTVNEVRESVQELGSELYRYRQNVNRLLVNSFYRTAKIYPFRAGVSDSSGKSLRLLSTLSASLCLARKLKQSLAEDEMVGILLPPSVAGVLANVAVNALGKVSVNLNYTTSNASFQSAIERCELKTIITCRDFLTKSELQLGDREVLFEDLVDRISIFEKIYTWLALFVTPRRLGEKLFLARNKSPKDTATIIFSSGSTGEPKGVMLSNDNISCNIESLFDVLRVKDKDCLIGALPFFHSFGFTVTLWYPLIAPIKAVYHSNPVDAATIGALAQKHRATVLLSTPTFLMSYIRKCSEEQFKYLRMVMVGAEKLKERVAESFYKKFGQYPREGYGCTELSPVAMINLEDYKGAEFQVGTKTGTVGRAIPGVATKVVDPQSFQPLAQGMEGLLLVKGANVMKGYYADEKRTQEVIVNGWYVTGDIASIDSDGFVRITDRLSRFSKIAGEMVPHLALEEEIHALLGVSEQVCVVCGLPNEKRGERLAVFITVDISPEEIIRGLSGRGLPNLWIPKKDAFVLHNSIPVLGSGKVDLKRVKELLLKQNA